MKKKILFANLHMNTGGVEKSLLDILQHLDYSKYEVDLLLFQGIGDYKNEIPEEVNILEIDLLKTEGSFKNLIINSFKEHKFSNLKFRLLSKKINKKLNPSLMTKMKKYWSLSKQYDIAIAYRFGFPMDFVAYLIEAKKKYVWWHHGSYMYSKDETYMINKTLENFDKIVFVSKACMEIAFDNGLKGKERAIIIPNMLDSEFIDKKSKEFIPYDKSENGNKIIVTVSRLSPEKHIENAVYAAELLVKNNVLNFTWYIVGNGSEYNNLKTIISDKNLEDKVILLGNQVNPYPYVRYADVYAHTSYVESQGIAILEAMSLGKLCVITESDGALEFCRDGYNSFLCEQNYSDLYSGIIKAFNYEECKIQNNAVDTVKTYTYKEVIPKIIDIL
ncbi:glycosyltransferase [uncultured Ruminococcus sp.]|uniref:glycosyltransferase n=1 Tax=uncultured Ruminococcus sp. TaxID=165186 RepID=UPI0025F51594|nr:glycosyltransferase [uncultured Ruminococcus sp.]